MKPISSKLSRPLIRAAYFLPLVVAILLLIFAAVPHIFYFYEGDPKQSQSLFELMSSVWDYSTAQLGGKVESTPDTMYFPYIMIFCIAVSWLSIFLYAIVAIPCALCSLIAFAFPPTSKNANQAKRWLQLFCPNRATFVIFQLLPILPACFPMILAYCQRTMFAMNLQVYYDLGIPDWLLVAVLVCLPIVLWLITLSSQSEEHMDMYRLYKSKK